MSMTFDINYKDTFYKRRKILTCRPNIVYGKNNKTAIYEA